MATTLTKIQVRRDTATNFAALNPVLGSGEPAMETDTRKLKFGDGVTLYSALEYWPPALTTAQQAAIVAGKIRSGGVAGGAAITIFVQATQPSAAAVGDLWFW